MAEKINTGGKQLCIHGHFYQPPREDPWMDTIFPEGSAAPARHWNERICGESYAPLAWARRIGGGNTITEIVNCYEWMSFNFGPTLLTWMQHQAPDIYARVLEGDSKSLERLGHGNAIAQIYHHVIMPLATDLEKRAEIAWALADFEARFGRRAEGLWLSEAAVDTRTLELLAQAGVKFTILAPRQAREVSNLGQDNWSPVGEGNLDIREPYLWSCPRAAASRSISTTARCPRLWPSRACCATATPSGAGSPAWPGRTACWPWPRTGRPTATTSSSARWPWPSP
jgi:alpha-amylase/alpha-mannosidase (GH57 family)